MRSLLLLLVGCASAPPEPIASPAGGPRGLRASEHRDLAHQHEALADQASHYPTPITIEAGVPSAALSVVTYGSYDSMREHLGQASSHRAQAATLEAAYDEACRGVPDDQIRVSPLAHWGTSGWPTAMGFIVYLGHDAGTPAQLLAAMRCHRAWMMLAPTDMDACPLDLPGLAVDARADATGVTVSLAVRDPKLVSELQRRVALDLEHHREVVP